MASPTSGEAPGHSPRSVLALLPDDWNGRGGIAECMRSAIAALAGPDMRAEVVVLSRRGHGKTGGAPGSVRWIGLAQRGKAAFAIALVAYLLFGRRPQLVLCGHLHLLPLALLAARRFGSPLLAYLHGIEAWKPPEHALARRSASRADRYVAVSKVTRNRFVEWSGADKTKIAVIPNAVRINQFGMGTKNPELVRRYQLEGKRVLMTMCRLDARQRHKGIDQVIEVLPQLLERHEDLVFVVVGEGNDLQRLKNKADSGRTAGCVMFTGWIDESEKADHLRLADAFTLAGFGDGFGIVLLEAMACGIPVVASSMDGSSEAILGGRLGQLADPGNTESLERALLRALELPKYVPPELAAFSFETYCRNLSQIVRPIMSPDKAAS